MSLREGVTITKAHKLLIAESATRPLNYSGLAGGTTNVWVDEGFSVRNV